MKLELRKFKIERGHDDSNPYSAEIWADNKLIALTSNDGWGGPDNHQIIDKEGYKKANEYVLSLPPLPKSTEFGMDFPEMKMDFYLWTGLEAEKLTREALTKRNQKKMEKLFANAVVLGTPGNFEEFTYYKFKHPLADILKMNGGKEGILRTIEKAKQKYPHWVVLNPNLEGLV